MVVGEVAERPSKSAREVSEDALIQELNRLRDENEKLSKFILLRHHHSLPSIFIRKYL